LIQIQIERIAGVGCDHNVEWLRHGDHRRLFHKGAARRVSGIQVTRKHAGDVFSLLSVTLSRNKRPALQGDLADFLPDRIAPRDAPRRVGIADHARIVIAQHCALSRHARHQRLAATRKAPQRNAAR
jgi:hypothetical protein